MRSLLLRPLRWLWNHPRILLGFATLIVLWRVIALGHLTYGDIPYFDVHSSHVNFLYAWGSEQLGTPVRQSLNTLRDAVLLLIAPANIVLYLLKYVLPIVLVPQLYYWILSRLGLRSKSVLLLGAIFPLFTPIVFGDFLTGQTFWIYLTVPMVLFYVIKIYSLKQFTLRNDLLLALWLFLSLGMLPPIIVPLIVVVAVFASVMMFTQTTRNSRWVSVSYIISGLRVGIVFGLLALPYLLVASSGQAAFTSPSLLGDYYHNYADTNLLNTLRMAGNNGSGQSTLGYNNWSLTNLFGYGIAAIMIGGGVMIGVRQRLSRYWIVVIGLMSILLFVLGFMQLLTINTLLGIKVFESQWLVSTVRNPSKLYVILLPIFVLLFAFGLGNILQRFGGALRNRRLIQVGVVAVVAIYGWPALRGDLGLLSGREEALHTYRQDPVVQQIAREPDAQQGRALLLPANHRDELNYQFLNPNLNLLRLEGSLPGSALTVDALNDTLNARNPYFFKYLSASGVKNVFVKKDPDAYQAALFDLFSVRLSPDQAFAFLKSQLPLAHETNDYWEFRNPTASDLVYSPGSLTYIDRLVDQENEAPFYGKNVAVVSEAAARQRERATNYRALSSVQQGQQIANGKAQLHDPNLILADVYRQGDQARLDIISPLDGSITQSLNIPLGMDGRIVGLGESNFIVPDKKQRITIRAGEYRALVSGMSQITIPDDPSFEQTGRWQPGDATPNAAGKANIYSGLKSEATDGRQSLMIGSGGHKAFVTLPLPANDDQALYVLQFDYKHQRGDAPSFSIYQGKQSLLPAEGGLGANDDWQTQTVFFAPNEGSKDPVNFYYYADGNTQNLSENLIDNIRLYQVRGGDTVPVTVPSYPPDYDLRNYRVPARESSLGQNLLDNNSFEDNSMWGPVGDATQGAIGKPDVNVAQSLDHTDGAHSLKLTSRNHTAYVARSVKRFLSNTVYKLSFDYKHIDGRAPSFAVWQDGAAVSKPAGELQAQQGWAHYETYFVPDPQTNNLTVYLYSRSNGEQTINLYDNVRLEPTSLVSTYLTQQSMPARPPNQIVQQYQRINPTTVKLTMKPGAGMVVFNESYHQGWQAFITNDGPQSLTQKLMLSRPGTLVKDHQTVNGFANGWWVDSADYPELAGKQSYTIILRYEPQKLLYGGLIVMGVTALVMAVYLAINWWIGQRETHEKA